MDLGSEIRDPERTYPGSRGKEGPGSATLLATYRLYPPTISCQLADNVGIKTNLPPFVAKQVAKRQMKI
jgi:hypothetical protein